MSKPFKKAQLRIAALASSLILIFLAWGGLGLPFDFQPDPNYSHVLNGLHLADTGRFDNTFYPGVVNFYLMALFNLVSGVDLPSSELFDISSVEKATHIARFAQATITTLALWAWLYAFSTLIDFNKNNYRERLAYSVALFATLCFMAFSYAFIYQTYFLRPDNSLSLCLALGLALFTKIKGLASNDGRVKHLHLLCVGVWVFFMTATKSQGQIFLGIGLAYLIYIGSCKKALIDQPSEALKISRAILFASLFGLLAVTLNGIDSFTFENKCAIFFLNFSLAALLLINLLSNSFFSIAALHIAAGWSICLVFTYFITGGQSQSVLEIANPIHTLIVQAKYKNLNISADPLIFHLKHLGMYGAVPILFGVTGAIAFRKKEIILLMTLGMLMIFVVSLRLPGYYNAILFMPFFCISAGLSIHCMFVDKTNIRKYIFTMLLIGIHIALNISLHSSHITALQAACLARGSLAGVRYDPDTINIKYTMKNEGWADYSKHYFTVITDFDYWPTIREKLKADKKFQELLQGTLITCTPP